jgi:predicted Ser/Thr protein kinase
MRQVTPFPPGHKTSSSCVTAFEVLRPLSFSSAVELCRERATGRLLVRKRFPSNAQAFFEREATTLHYLRHFSASPQLYFAWQEEDGTSVLGREYFSGSPLCDAQNWNAEEKSAVASALKALVQELHDKFGMSHGDISPRNVLVIREQNAPLKLGLLDWEFARKFQTETLESYSSFRGSVGFTEVGEHNSLREKDLLALAACWKELGLPEPNLATPPLGSKPKTEKRRWLWT